MIRLFFLFFLLSSCSSSPHPHNSPGINEGEELPTQIQFSFPDAEFEKLVLLRVNEENYSSFGLPGNYKDEVPSGFVDSSGNPDISYFKKYTLSTIQTQEIVSYLNNPFLGEATTCAPIYRDVLIFYDSKLSQVAQAQICFDCRHVLLRTRKGTTRYQMADKAETRITEIIEKLIKS